MRKQEIRALMKAKELAVSKEREPAASASLCNKISGLKEYCTAESILIYMALPGEVSLSTLLSDSHKKFVLPRVAGDSLELYKYDKTKLETGYKGIIEPSTEAERIDVSTIDLAIIPGVAFDSSGHRLGHGKGFYDRLLPNLHCPVIGVCFDYRIVDSIDCDPWDIPVDLVLETKV